MTKYTEVYIECDMCGKRHDIDEKKGYPYNEGWIYLYNLNLQKPTISTNHKCYRLEKTDKHFCSQKCFMRYIDTIIKIGDFE